MNSQASKAAKAASKAAADNRSRASSQDKAASRVAKAASKGAADNRSRASSQDKAASRVASRNLSKAVNRLSAEFGQYSDEMASGVDWSACHWRPSPTPRASRLERFAGGLRTRDERSGGAKPWGKQAPSSRIDRREHDAEFRYLTGALLETNKRTIQHKRKRCVCNLLIGGATSP
jgi:hypothetical protein